MGFSVFKQRFTKSELRKFPELSRFSLPDDRWLLLRFKFRANKILLVPALVYLAVFVVVDLAPGILEWYPFRLLIGLSVVAMFVLCFCLGLTEWGDRRYRSLLHESLNAKRVFFCSSFECRYNCTGIRGNRCPECGAVVPGLVSE